MRTRVWVNQECLFHAPPWQLRQGRRRPTKGSIRLPPMFPACRWWRRWRQRDSGGGGVAGVFPFSLSWRRWLQRLQRCRGCLSIFLVL
jgi:hypothetical protein